MARDSQEQHTIIALVEDKPGVLTRVASMFRRRGFNIVSLAVGESENPGLSRMTFVVNGDEYTVGQVTKQLDKLIDVIQVSDISERGFLSRELALIKVATSQATRGEIIQISNLFRANIVDVGPASMVIEITAGEARINALQQLLEPFGVLEMLRTGLVAMVRGRETGMETGNESMPVSANGSGRLSERGSV